LRTDISTTRDAGIATGRNGLYGVPSTDVVDLPADAIQFSPLMPGAAELEAIQQGTLASMAMLAPPGTLERRYAMALALRAVAPGGIFTALAPKDHGGNRLRKELEAFGCAVEETARRHHRIAICKRPANLTGIEEATQEGGPQMVAENIWSQPGVFSWDRLDPGTALLLEHLPAFAGRGADFGCGIGILTGAVLSSEKVEQITSIDIDRRAIQAARRNITDPRAHFLWADVRSTNAELRDLDFVVMNAPFHDAGTEDRGLPLAFVKRAAQVLRTSGVCWLVANRHLPYEAAIKPLFKRIDLKVESRGYKICELRK
jgi:16S rRNA (guanine1207-N2)-methyltransferase